MSRSLSKYVPLTEQVWPAHWQQRAAWGRSASQAEAGAVHAASSRAGQARQALPMQEQSGAAASLPVVGSRRCCFAAALTALPPLPAGALIIYTSGTTGKPKGVLHTHRCGR
jgi:acyl-coenzyme A synthetase/AMP-(fatty) acid ligase